MASFLSAIAVGTILLLLPASQADGQQLGLIDALFMATSAVCINGLAVIDPGGQLSGFGQSVILILIQIGGLGILTLGVLVAIATGRRIGFKERLEYQLQTNTQQVGGVVRLLRSIVVFALITEAIGASVLYLRLSALNEPQALFKAVFHSVSAFNHAGLALFDDSLMRFATDPVISLTISTLVIIASLGTVVIFELLLRLRGPNRTSYSLHTRLVLITTALLLAGGTVIIAILEWTNPGTLQPLSAGGKVLTSFFQSVTTRSAGYNTLEIGAMHEGTLLFIILLMFIGASPGSTGGGIKTVTFLLLAASSWQLARGRTEVSLLGRRIAPELLMKAAVICTLGVLLAGGATTVLTVTEPGMSILGLAFESVSALSNVGLSLGITPQLSPVGKIVITVLMFLGRIGLLTFLLALVQSQKPPTIRYPREDVLIG